MLPLTAVTPLPHSAINAISKITDRILYVSFGAFLTTLLAYYRGRYREYIPARVHHASHIVGESCLNPGPSVTSICIIFQIKVLNVGNQRHYKKTLVIHVVCVRLSGIGRTRAAEEWIIDPFWPGCRRKAFRAKTEWHVGLDVTIRSLAVPKCIKNLKTVVINKEARGKLKQGRQIKRADQSIIWCIGGLEPIVYGEAANIKANPKGSLPRNCIVGARRPSQLID